MVLTRKNSNHTLGPANGGPKPPKHNLKTAWNVVASGKSRTNHPLPLPPTATSSQWRDESLMEEASTSSNTFIRPFLKGIESNSILIDVTDLSDPQLLRSAMQAFNKDDDGYEDYLGRLTVVRKYLGRSFIETLWTVGSTGYQSVLNGITLEDGTVVKGFPSYSAEATIIKIDLEKLPFLPTRLLKRDMYERMSQFGEVLDLGIKKHSGCFTGCGYVTIDVTPKPDAPPYEPLDHIILWDLEAGVPERHVQLQWNDMPDFCRICHASDHCRADCPKLKEFLKCHNCNLRGHVIRDCPRNNQVDIVSAPNKKRVVLTVKDRKIPQPTTESAVPLPPSNPSVENLPSPEAVPVVNDVDMADSPSTENISVSRSVPPPTANGAIPPNHQEQRRQSERLIMKIPKFSAADDITSQRRFSIHENLSGKERQILSKISTSSDPPLGDSNGSTTF